MAPYSERVSHFDPCGRNQDCDKAINSKFNATSAANARMSAANRGSAKVSFWNSIRQRLEKFSLEIPRIGAIPVRPFATDSRYYSQAEHGRAQEALFEAEAEAEIACLERQLLDRQISTVAADGKPQAKPAVKDREPHRGRKYFRKVKFESLLIRNHISDPSPRQKQSRQVISQSPIRKHKSDLGPRQKNYGQAIQQSLIRTHLSQSGPLGRYVKDELRLPFPVNMLDRKMNADSAENNASESQLDIWKYHKSEAENETRKTREPRRVATDRNSPIRFISDRKTEDAHIEVQSKLGSESTGMSIEQNAELIEIRRYLSSGQTPKLPSIRVRNQRVPSTVVPIQRVPGFYVSKHSVAEKVVTAPEGSLLIRTHSVGSRSQEPASDLSHPTRAGDIQEIKPDSPKDQARELHSRYSLRSLHENSPSKDSRTS